MPSSLYDLLPELRRLDLLLEQAVAKVPAVFGVQPGADPFRGLHTSQCDVEQLLARAPGVPAFGSASREGDSHHVGIISGSLAWLARVFSLTPFEIDVLLLALAPEVDLRYERIYGYVQDDVTRRRPSVDLALGLFSATVEQRLAKRSTFASDSVLIRRDLIHLIPDPHQAQPSLLSHFIKLDPQIVRLLLGRTKPRRPSRAILPTYPFEYLT